MDGTQGLDFADSCPNLNHIPNPKPNESALCKSTFTYLLTYSKISAMADRPHTTRDTVPVPNCILIVTETQYSTSKVACGIDRRITR